MRLQTPLDTEDDTTDARETPGAAQQVPSGYPQAVRSASVELAEMDNIVNTQDDVMRRYVDLRDGLDVLEQEVSFIRTLARGTTGQSASGARNSGPERPEQSDREQVSEEEEEEIDR